MAEEPADVSLLPDFARSWVEALEHRFGPCVQTRLIEAACPLVDQYLQELGLTLQSDSHRERHLARMAAALAYHCMQLVEASEAKAATPPSTRS